MSSIENSNALSLDLHLLRRALDAGEPRPSKPVVELAAFLMASVGAVPR